MTRYRVELQAVTKQFRTVEAATVDEACDIAEEAIYDEVVEVDRNTWTVIGVEVAVTAPPWTEYTADGYIAVGSNSDRRRTAILLEPDEWEALVRAARAGHLDVPAIRARSRGAR